MAGKKIWNSLTTSFQVELINNSEELKKGRACDGVFLQRGVMKCVYPTTKVPASNHKDFLDAAFLKDFGHDVKVFKNWFEDRRRDIIRDEGADKHKEHIRHLFKTYLTATNQDFVVDIKNERTNWMTGKKYSS